ncbi:response regulator [Ancylothrix sp. C2]|uniref:hybrid sensor histidine kinase/response regulator n=1 Tax=Ancylothrix sp. D3o TaxID=2953691 RepID=UPI0021BAC9DC|nr:response regulator [Ancylothrix sp. D3o]MCT7951031.1 response regulator [Ancylothrix sp. D3o]
MLPEQQQRIMGYFIEEAKEHLNTIEHGLLNLQATIEDPEIVKEVFRAAHSVKGGAAMLGLTAIKTTAHLFEDCFKILEECPVVVDQKLETLFLKVFDAMQALLEQIQTGAGETPEVTAPLMANVEPTIAEITHHLKSLVSTSDSRLTSPKSPQNIPTLQPSAASLKTPTPYLNENLEVSALQLIFQSDVPQGLREMLELFKQQPTSQTRKKLQDICHRLIAAGEQFELQPWCDLIEAARQAINDPKHTFSSLAPVIIRDIKQAQEFVLAGKTNQIAISNNLQILQPPQTITNGSHKNPEKPDSKNHKSKNTATSFAMLPQQPNHNNSSEPATPASQKAGTSKNPAPSTRNAPAVNSGKRSRTVGPEVGMAELTSLADLFEGEAPELDSTWEAEEIIDSPKRQELSHLTQSASLGASSSEELDSDFADLLFEEDTGNHIEEITSVDELNNLFGDSLLNEDNWNQTETPHSTTDSPTTGTRRRNHPDLFSMQESADDLEALFAGNDADEDSPAPINPQNSVINQDSQKTMEWEELWNTPESETSPVNPPTALNTDTSLDFETLFDQKDNITKPETSNFNSTNTKNAVDSDSSLDLSELLSIGDFSETAASSLSVDLEEIKAEWGDLELDSASLFEEEFEPKTNNDDDFDAIFFQTPPQNSPALADSSLQSQSDDLDALFADLPELENKHNQEGVERRELKEEKTPPTDNLPTANSQIPTSDLNGEEDLFAEETSSFDNSFNELFEEKISENTAENSLSDELFGSDDGGVIIDADSLFDEELDLVFESDAGEATASTTDSLQSDDFGSLFFVDTLLTGNKTKNSRKFLEEVQPKNNQEIIFEEELTFDELMGELEPAQETTAPLSSKAAPAQKPTPVIPVSEPVIEPKSKEKNSKSTETASFLLLEALLEQPCTEAFFDSQNNDPATLFTELEALLDRPSIPPAAPQPTLPQIIFPAQTNESQEAFMESLSDSDGMETDEFADLHELLRGAEKSLPGSRIAQKPVTGSGSVAGKKQKSFVEQTMRVPIKQLDNLSNLVGELVVNRNSLEQDQERLRQFLDNLLHQVSQLSDVGQRMQDLYERSLLEISLLSSRQHYQAMRSGKTNSHSTGAAFDALEMDRFTGFHTQSQEIIELIVRVRESAADIEFLVDETEQVTRQLRQITTQLQEGLTRSRMVPFSSIEKIFPLARAVRDKAIEHEKQAEVRLEGRDTMLDKLILEHLSDPLKHLINNAIAHGIETPAVRIAAGKPPVGRITIRSFHQGNQTVISFSDDGAGIDTEKVKRKAIEKKLITAAEAASMGRPDVYELLYHPGFSTMEKANMTAGRGVGMDVIRNDLSEIRGVISTDSSIGKGTTFTIRLPLTLSISKALCCISDRARIAFPMDGVEDMLDVPRDRVQITADGQMSIAWRDSMLSFRHLRELLGYNRHLGRGNVYGTNAEDDVISVVVLRSAGNYLALQVDQVLGEQEIVIKQLEGPVPKPVGVAGATVMGDGRIVAIADVLELIDLAAGRIRKEAGGNLWDDSANSVPVEIIEKNEPTVLIVDDSITVRELLSMTFNKAGYRVEQARDGQEAWEKLRSGLPCDIVFCDIEMPRMDGLELLSRMQKDAILTNLPIAMLTSRGADRHRQMAVSLGARGYFTKPYLEEALLEAATRMLKGEVLVMTKGE